MKAEVPEGSLFTSLLHLTTYEYTVSLPTNVHLLSATEETVIFRRHFGPCAIFRNLVDHLKAIKQWLTHWRIKVWQTQTLPIEEANMSPN